MKYDLHTHYYPKSYFDKIRELSTDFTFDTDPTGRTIIKLRGARFFGITPPMTDPAVSARLLVRRRASPGWRLPRGTATG